MSRQFISKKAYVDYSIFVDRKLPKKPPRGKKKWEYHLKEEIDYLGHQLYSKLYTINESCGRFKEGDKVLIRINNVDLLKVKRTTYYYDPYKQQNLNPGILDSDDHIFDPILGPVSEEE